MHATHTLPTARRNRRWAVTTIAVALMGAAAAPAAWAQTVTGSGRTATEARNLPGFAAIRLDGAFNVVAKVAPSQSVQVQADDNLLPLIETVVEDRNGLPTLVLRTKPGSSYRTHITAVVTVDATALKALTLAGSGDIRASGVNGERLVVDLGGSGNVTLNSTQVRDLQVRLAGSGDVRGTGRTGKLDVSLAGSGDVKLAALTAEEVKVTLAGSGDVDVHADQSLQATIVGSGDVRHQGNATAVKATVLGSGAVKRR